MGEAPGLALAKLDQILGERDSYSSDELCVIGPLQVRANCGKRIPLG